MDLNQYANAIASIESAGSGDYQAVGPRTGKGNRAYGRYQVMDFNIGPWTEKYLGQRLTPEQFLANPNAQDAVFQGEFGSYIDRFGNPQDAASAWFTGRPLSEGAGRSDILGTTGSSYVQKFNAALGQPQGGNMQPNVSQRGPVISTSGTAQQPAPQGQAEEPFYKNPDFWDRLAIGFSGMTLNPNEALINASAQRIDRRAEGRQTEKQRNATAEWLRSQGRDDLADAVLSGAIGGRDALGLMQPEKQGPTAAMQNYEFLVQRGVPPEEAQKQAFGRGGNTVIIGSQQSTAYGDAPKGTVWEYDEQGNHVMEPAPGGGMRPKVTPLGGTEAEKRAADISGGAKSNQDAAARAQDSMNLIKSVMDDPALGQVTGMFQGRIPPITQAGTDLGVKIEQLQGQAFLAAFESLKGGGQITEREGQAAQNAMARLQRAQSEKAFRASLAELYDIMGRARRRASGETVPDIDVDGGGFSVTGRIK